VLAPDAGKRREHPVGIAVLVDDSTRRDGIRRPRPHQRDAVARERSLDIKVALPSVRAEVLGDVHRGRVRGSGDGDHLLDEIAAT
jgi:hypothetical protein